MECAITEWEVSFRERTALYSNQRSVPVIIVILPNKPMEIGERKRSTRPVGTRVGPTVYDRSYYAVTRIQIVGSV